MPERTAEMKVKETDSRPARLRWQPGRGLQECSQQTSDRGMHSEKERRRDDATAHGREDHTEPTRSTGVMSLEMGEWRRKGYEPPWKGEVKMRGLQAGEGLQPPINDLSGRDGESMRRGGVAAAPMRKVMREKISPEPLGCVRTRLHALTNNRVATSLVIASGVESEYGS